MHTNSPETAPPRASKGRGRPAYLPTDEHHIQVKLMAGYGIPQDSIAKCLGISAPTMRKHYRELLTVSAVEANTNVLTSLYQMATVRHNTAAAIFWAKTRCGYRAGGAPYEEAPKAPQTPAPSAKPAPAGYVFVNNDGAPLDLSN